MMKHEVVESFEFEERDLQPLDTTGAVWIFEGSKIGSFCLLGSSWSHFKSVRIASRTHLENRRTSLTEALGLKDVKKRGLALAGLGSRALRSDSQAEDHRVERLGGRNSVMS